MAIDKTGKILAEFNAKNGQYKTSSGTLSSLAWLTKVALEKVLNTNDLYGDGDLQLTMVSDRGSTGTITMSAHDEEFETALGFKQAITDGVAEIQQVAKTSGSLYFETQYVGSDGAVKTKKVWLFGVEVSTPSETFDQNTDNINTNVVEYGIVVRGTNLKNSAGTADYTDANGNTRKVYKMTSIPTDEHYATFGDAVPVPKALAA